MSTLPLHTWKDPESGAEKIIKSLELKYNHVASREAFQCGTHQSPVSGTAFYMRIKTHRKP